MARTPLFQALKNLVGEHTAARNANLSLQALREQRQEAKEQRLASESPDFSRRQFLALTGALALGAAMPRFARAADQPKIAIVGGGIAGLTCALMLADRGIKSTVYEASARVGGRMFSNSSGYWDNRQTSEWCGEFIDSGHKTIRHLAKRFGLMLDDLSTAPPNGSEDTYHFLGNYYSQAQADKDFAAVVDALQADADAAGYPTTYDSFTAEGKVLDNMSVYAWIESRVPGGHTSLLGQLLDVAYATEYGADTQDQSALNLLYLLGFQPNASALSIFGESDERYRIRGGNEKLPRTMGRHLSDCIELSRALQRIKQTSGGRYRLDFSNGSTTQQVVADYVVLALPFAVLQNLNYEQAGFDALKQRAIQEQGRGHNSKLQLQFRKRLWNQTGAWPGVSNGSSYADTGYQSTWDATRKQGGTSGIINFYSAANVTDSMQSTSAFAKANDALVVADANRALTQSTAVFPGLAENWNGKATQSLPHKSRLYGASYSYYRVGQYTAFGGYEKAPQGRIFFCGEHTSTDFQGYMEGGASEGKRVGQELALLLKNYAKAAKA